MNDAQLVSIHRLPEELLILIWDYLALLDKPAPSVANFDCEPSYSFTKCTSTPLKDLSLVCKRWRILLLPSLFSYSRVALSPMTHWIGLTPELLQLCERHIPGSPRASSHELELVKGMRKSFWSGNTRDTHIATMEYVSDEDITLLRITKELRCWIPSARGEITEYLAFIDRYGLATSIESFTLSCDQAFDGEDATYSCATRECTALWKAVFSLVSPLRVVIAAHPTVMALLTSGRLGAHDDWLFNQDLHYLELSRSNDSVACRTSSPFQVALHNIRQWTNLSYNEGSSIPAYKQYEYFHYSSPAVLSYLLLWITKEQDYPSATQLQSVKYVACFPIAGHVSEILRILKGVRNLKSLETRLSPDANSDMLDDARMGTSDRKDCWQEFNSCYHHVLKFFQTMETGKRHVSVKIADYGNESLKDDLDKILQLSRWTKDGDVWKPRL